MFTPYRSLDGTSTSGAQKDLGLLQWMLEFIMLENLPPKLHHYYDQWKVMQEI